MRELKPSNREWNEEELRTHVLVPFLQALGVEAAHVRVEWRFTLRLGRTLHHVDGTPVNGRADALIKNASGDSLFIVELKAPGHKLTDEDRDQAISYARLLPNIAPFVIVSNGAETHIYDTITRLSLDSNTFHTQSSFFKDGRTLASAEDIRIRFEALEHFVGYSRENVHAFSTAHVQRGIRSLLGTPDTRNKYVRELYIPRERVRTAFREFLSGDASVFALVGESGSGKTNELCALAEELSATHLVLFFAGHEMSRPLDQVLADEFNWAFSQRLDAPQIVGNLVRVAKQLGMPLLVFIDALDEAAMPGFPASCSDFARHFSGMPEWARLVVSAKRTEWERFATLSGNPSYLKLGMFGSYAGGQTEGETAWRSGAPVLVEQFSEAELNTAYPRYRDYFRLGADVRGEARSLCRSPFFLRTYGEAYQGIRHAPQHLTSDMLIRSWLNRKLTTLGAAHALWTKVRVLAERIYVNASNPAGNRSTHHSMEAIDDDHVTDLDLDELVAHGVVVKTMDDEHRASFRFYYGQVLYYLVARHVLKLDKLTAPEFRQLMPRLLENYALQGVLSWHLQNAPANHHRELEAELDGRALAFVTTYSDIFYHLVPALRERVTPYGGGDIGLAYIINDFGFAYFGLYVIGPATPMRVTRLDANAPVDRDALWKLTEFGCKDVRGGGRNFANTPSTVAAAEYALAQIRKVVEKANLDERSLPSFLVEVALAIVGNSDIRQKLQLPRVSFRPPFRHPLIPLDLHALDFAVQKYLALEEYRNEWTREQSPTRSAYVTEREGGYSVDLTGFDAEAMQQRIDREIQSGVRFPRNALGAERRLARLTSLLRELLSQGIESIQADVLRPPDRGNIRFDTSPMDSYSDDGASQFLEDFFRDAFGGYTKLVEANFGPITSLFTCYQKYPFTIVAAFTRDPPGTVHSWGRVEWGYDRAADSKSDLVVADVRPSRRPYFERDAGRHLFASPQGYTVSSIQHLDLSSLFRSSDSIGDRDMPIRGFAYMLLRRDLELITSQELLELLAR